MEQGTGQDQPAAPAGESTAAGEPSAAGETAPAREMPATGESRVDAALAALGDLGELPVSGHPPVYERIHGQLVEVLGELHSGPAGSAG